MLRGSSVISLLREVKISAMKKVFVFDLKREKKEEKKTRASRKLMLVKQFDNLFFLRLSNENMTDEVWESHQ